MNDHETLDHFIDRLRTGAMEPQEFVEMERRLLADPAFRREYRARMRMESGLLSAIQAARPDIAPPLMIAPRGRMIDLRRWIPIVATGIAAAVAIGFFAGNMRAPQPGPPTIARLESSSVASWIHGAPGGIGSPLASGTLELSEGLAEIRFTSGVLLSLEAPAHIELIDPMRCRLLSGLAVIDVPDGAEGFIVETPEGHVVDYGTRFSVNVDGNQSVADFEVLNGKVSVHHASSGAELSLTDAQAARLTGDGIQTLETLPSATLGRSRSPGVVRLQTNGRETCILRNASRSNLDETMDPDLLMIKKDLTRYGSTTNQPAHRARDRRSLVGFELGKADPKRIGTARLRLNLVPTGLGYASSLPETCTFKVFGIRDDLKLEAWPTEGLRWENAPGSFKGAVQGNALADGMLDLDEVRLLGSLDLPRGMVTGPVVFESSELTAFLREDTTGQVSFLLVRATSPLDGWSLVHAFASSTHPDAAGPTLELELTETDGR